MRHRWKQTECKSYRKAAVRFVHLSLEDPDSQLTRITHQLLALDVTKPADIETATMAVGTRLDLLINNVRILLYMSQHAADRRTRLR